MTGIPTSGLATVSRLGSREVFKVLVVCDDIDWGQSSFEVVVPGLECLKDGQELLVMYIIV